MFFSVRQHSSLSDVLSSMRYIDTFDQSNKQWNVLYLSEQKTKFFILISNRSSRICRAIHSEADLDLSCLRRLIYGSDSDTSNSESSFHFALISQPEINRSEANELDEFYRKLNDTYKKLAKIPTTSDDNDESLCIICYSHHIQAEFRPCKHQACL